MNKSRKIGQCIYCGSTNEKLSREHIVPYGLNGEWTLLEASCQRCSKITSDFERHALRDIFLSARSSFGLRSRKKSLPKNFTIRVAKNGKESDLVLTTKEHGAIVCLLEHKAPAYLENRRYTKGIDVIGSCLVRTKGKDLKELGKEKDFDSIIIKSSFQGNNFERFIAKIAYCFSVFQFGVNAFENIYVLPAILREKDDIGMWLGSTAPVIGKADLESNLEINKNNEVVARIRLFGKLSVPTYIVVVGKLK